ncbi:DsbA family protein [Haloplanus salilacus]|uniref:DsbA family protein n=1 Tax=Haloplanus salilacus TaxID=2949994 RepID=UPI0030D2FC9B
MERTRRAYLAATAGLAGLSAGCLGGGGGGGTEDCDAGDEPTVAELPAPTLGPDDPDVTVAAFEDFSCPHCATFSLEVIPELRSEYVEPGVIRFEHHDFPIPVDERWSWQAGSAARGVQDEVGDEAFFEYAHALFENQGDFSPALITDLAEDVGAPGCAIQADAVNETYRPVLEADRQSGLDSGVEGTPGVFVGDRLVEPTYDAISAAIEAQR